MIIVSRLLKIHRIIFNAEKSLKYFGLKTYTIENFKFVDLALAIPFHEVEDFFLNETYFDNVELYSRAYVMALAEIFKEKQEDLPKAKRRHFWVILVTTTARYLFIFAALRMIYAIVLNAIN